MQSSRVYNFCFETNTCNVWFSEKSDGCSAHLIDGDGTFNDTGLEQLIKEVKLGACGLSYAIVSIMGPQSSGMNFFHSLMS